MRILNKMKYSNVFETIDLEDLHQNAIQPVFFWVTLKEKERNIALS